MPIAHAIGMRIQRPTVERNEPSRDARPDFAQAERWNPDHDDRNVGVSGNIPNDLDQFTQIFFPRGHWSQSGGVVGPK
jgi:hypothetical protein